MQTGRSEIVAQLRALGAKRGGVLLAHISYRAARPVEGGPVGLIEALRAALGPEGTLVMPSWGDGAEPFDPARTPADPDLGATADIFWRQPGVMVAAHAFAFAAAGSQAEAILRDRLPLPPHRRESPRRTRAGARRAGSASRLRP
ncbi:aminoglycoside N3'-acetyltransferase [Amphiplicatus metriothermophilus]|nr:AAC(3) family N-acetyltransferase [Amphiplicatus metriothermophilus]MBB5519917.1 aminoglycoside N3'-acetyltransferase [Amphiplicatus metriothermophilus]